MIHLPDREDYSTREAKPRAIFPIGNIATATAGRKVYSSRPGRRQRALTSCAAVDDGPLPPK
jgi:hypothetical protein